jgi:hypothetical protein
MEVLGGPWTLTLRENLGYLALLSRETAPSGLLFIFLRLCDAYAISR